MRLSPEQESAFDAFVVARGGALRRTAYLLCGDWHQAEDLVQTALAKVYVRWHRIRDPDAVHAYVRQIVARAFMDMYRKRSSREQPIGEIPEVTQSRDGDPDTRLALLAALAQVSPGCRAVLVLRFWEDLSIEQTAQLLGRKSGSVRASTTRGLEQLRTILGDHVFELAQP